MNLPLFSLQNYLADIFFKNVDVGIKIKIQNCLCYLILCKKDNRFIIMDLKDGSFRGTVRVVMI